MQGHPAPRRQARERAPGTVKRSLERCSADEGECGGLIPTVADPISANEASTYTHEGKNNFRLHNCVTQEVANPLTHRMHKGINTTMDEGQTMVAHALRADGFDAGEDGTGRGTPLVAFQTRGSNLDIGEITGTIGSNADRASGSAPCVAQPYTLAIRGRGDSHNLEYRTDGTANAVLTPNGGRGGIGVGAVAFTCSEQSNGFAWETDVWQTLDAQIPNDSSNIQRGIRQGWAVRRLTPGECEKLQGFPPNYTQVPYRGKPAADGPRYKALGNSMAVNVMQWLGTRIQMVDDIVKENGDDQAR